VRRLYAVLLLALLVGCSSSTGSAPSSAPTPASASSSAAVPTASTAATAANDLLLVTESSRDALAFVDPRRGVVDRVRVGVAPYGVVLGDDATAYVATAQGLAVVDTATRRRTALVRFRAAVGRPAYGEFRAGGLGLAVSPDGRRVYVGVHHDGRDTLEAVDLARGRVVGSAPVGERPFDVLVSRDGRQVYSVDHDSFTVTIVDSRTYAARPVTVAPFGTEGGLASYEKPHYAQLDGRGRLLLPYQGLRLAVLDPRTGRVSTRRMTARTHQHGTALDRGRLLVVGTGPFGNASGPPSLTVRTLATGRERVWPLRRLHEQVAVSTDGRTAWLTGGFTLAGYWNGLTGVELATGRTRELRVPGRPLGVAVLPATERECQRADTAGVAVGTVGACPAVHGE
jgi:DNA-binding beta-propeller fold protein YncE